jgi:hypothetical protein
MVMKKLLLLVLLLPIIAIPEVYGQKKRDKVVSDSIAIVKDSIEYELIIIDSGFEMWLMSQPPMGFHSNEYYRQRNLMYVQEWNSRYMNPMRHGGLYENYVDYSATIDYGIELNYRLYYYFVYFERTNNVKLISGRR